MAEGDSSLVTATRLVLVCLFLSVCSCLFVLVCLFLFVCSCLFVLVCSCVSLARKLADRLLLLLFVCLCLFVGSCLVVLACFSRLDIIRTYHWISGKQPRHANAQQAEKHRCNCLRGVRGKRCCWMRRSTCRHDASPCVNTTG